jgi:hypothetical protein
VARALPIYVHANIADAKALALPARADQRALGLLRQIWTAPSCFDPDRLSSASTWSAARLLGLWSADSLPSSDSRIERLRAWPSPTSRIATCLVDLCRPR